VAIVEKFILARDLYHIGIYLITIKMNVMGNLLYVLAVILLVGWLLGMFAFNAGGFIHVLLVIAVIIFLVKLIGGNRTIEP
jgi:Family of unknown function (DUF5670)